jgi:cytochrome b561
MKTWEIKVANTMKKALNILLILLPISGYLSLTSKGVAPTFLEIEMPLIITESHNLHEVMEETHELLALSVMGLVLLHATAAFKHHFLNKDDTLLKMLGKVKN